VTAAAARKRYLQDGKSGLNPVKPYYFDASTSLLAAEPANPSSALPVAPAYLGWPSMFAHLEARNAALKTWRLSWWRTCGDIARFELPRRFHYWLTENDYQRGIRKDGAILNNTATLDGETCAGGVMTVCTDPDRQWLKLGAPPGVEVDRVGQIFFDDLTERLRFVQDRTSFYESLSQYYEDLVFFGTGVAMDYEDKENIFVSTNPCSGEYCLTSAADGESGELFIEERKTVEQIVNQFGLENCPNEVVNAWRQKGGALEQEFVVGRAIEPNFAIVGEGGSDVGRLPGHFSWREIYWVIGRAGTGPLSVAGFHEKPFAASQWHRVSNDPYGRGPGWTVLGDTIELQILTAREAELVEKMARPPMSAPVGLKNEPHSTKPDHVTYYDAQTGAPQFKPVYEPNPQGLMAIRGAIEGAQDRIHRGMHADLFRMIQELSDRKGDVTATEIDALREERLMQLGSVIGRVYRYGIRPRIERQLSILRRRGLYPQIPQSLAKVPLQIEFISMLTLAQRAGAVGSIERTFSFAQAVGADPRFADSGDVLDADEAVREAASLRGAPSRIIRGAADVKKIRAARQQQVQAAQQAATAQAAVAGAHQLSQTSMSSDNALGAMLKGPGQ
jgi:hypothetical protein